MLTGVMRPWTICFFFDIFFLPKKQGKRSQRKSKQLTQSYKDPQSRVTFFKIIKAIIIIKSNHHHYLLAARPTAQSILHSSFSLLSRPHAKISQF